MTSNITQNDIEKWLRSLRCEQYIERFNKYNITPDIFPELDLDALKEIGIRKVGDRLKILLLIEKINVEILKGKVDPEKLYTGISSAADTLNSTLEKIFIEKSENTKPQYIVAISQYGSAIRLNVENCYSALSVKQRALKYLEKSDAYSSNSNIYNYYSNSTPVSASQTSFFSDTSTNSTIQTTAQLPINYDCYVIEQENGSYHKLFDVELVTLCHSKTLNEKEKCIVICQNDDFPSEDSINTYNKIQNLNNLNSIPFAGNQSLEKRNSVRYNNNHPDLTRPKSQLGYHYNNTSTSNYSNQTLTSSTATNIDNTPPHPFDHDMKDFMGQRPPSQVISINLAEYFPETRANELKEVMRNSVRLSMYGARLQANSVYLTGGPGGQMVNGFGNGHSHTNSVGSVTPHIPLGSSSPSSVASSSPPPPAGLTLSPHTATAHGNNNMLELPSFIPPSYKRSSVSTVSSIGSRLSTFSTYSVGTATQVPTVGDVLLNNSNAVETVLNTDKYGNAISKSGSLRRQHSYNNRPGSTIAVAMEESNYLADKRHRSLSRHHSTSNSVGSSSLARGKSMGSNHATSSPTPLSHSYSNRRSVNGGSALRQSYNGATDDAANTTQVSSTSLRRQESNSATAKAKRLSRFSVSTFGSTNNDMLPLAKSLTLDGEFDDHDFFDDDDIDNYVEREFLNHSGEHILSDPSHQTILEDDQEDIHSSNSAEKLKNSNNITDENKMFNLKGLPLSSENLLLAKNVGDHKDGREDKGEETINDKLDESIRDDSVDADITEEDYYGTVNASNAFSDEEANRNSTVIELFEDGAFDEDPVNAPDDLIERLALENESGPSVWHKGARIGQGSFGTVYLGLNGITGELMAVKQVEIPEEVNSIPSLTNINSKDSAADSAYGAGAASSSDNLTLGNKLSLSTLAAAPPPKKNKDGKNEAEKKGNTMINALRQEMLLLRELNHENIVRYLGSSSDDKFLYIFLEYIPGGSVSSMLNTYGPFEEPLIRNFVTQVLVGLKYLHGEGIIHRDIKGANILIDINGTVKISDFGISKKIRSARKIDGKGNSDSDDTDNSDTSENENYTLDDNKSKKRASLQGSVYWMAPEVVKQIAYTDRADIWSLGCLIVEMFTGKHPYPGFSQMQAIFRIGTLIVPEIPSWATIQAKDFLTLALEPDYKSRTDAAGLLTHPFITPLISSNK
ncbi:hypothetical protein BVG19_g5133 [[Candida] boidinii]|nr:hypothetical protein BVG19_g5133 [[Candida] boidinii]OWB53438.1 hypothetical protein B5S27_g5034 [[Candida] boidinii]